MHPVHGEFLIMPLLASETIPDNVIATQHCLALRVVLSINSSSLKNLSFLDAARLDEFVDHTR